MGARHRADLRQANGAGEVVFGFNPWLLGSVAAILIAALTFGGCEHRNAGAARVERDQARASLATALHANETNQVTISKLEDALKHWVALATPSGESVAAGAQAEADRAELLKTREKLDRLAREKDNAKPDCDALRAIDFQRLCPARAQRLRERAAGNGHAHS